MERVRFDHENGRIWMDEQRMLLLHAGTFGDIRSELIESLGIDRARRMMMRMGFASGKADARATQKLRPDMSVEERFAIGPQLHTLEGVALVEPIKFEIDIPAGHYYGEFYWHGSLEAEEHRRSYGVHSEATCWNQIGYACGYTSEFIGKPILYKELECSGCGDEKCRIVGKPVEQWEDGEELLACFDAESVAETLLTLNEEVQSLKEGLQTDYQFQDIIADAEPTKQMLEYLATAARCDVTVLMLGETGVGKEVFSQALFNSSDRRHCELVAVNCATLPRNLVESELFGVEKGAFTGAEKSRPGRFERAHGGMLFLDEVGELSDRAQAKLLRVLQTGEMERVGDTRVRKVDVRVVAATNADLEQRVKDGTFRADLYYRLNVFPILIPPLRDRPDDIPGLVAKFIRRYNAKYGKNILGLSDRAIDAMRAYQWPGNIRELENLIERGVILCVGKMMEVDSLFPDNAAFARGSTLSAGLLSANGEDECNEDVWRQVVGSGLSIDEIEKHILERALADSSGNASKAARLLRMTDAQFRYRVKKHEISA